MTMVRWALCLVLLAPSWLWAAASTTYIPRETVRTISAATYTTVVSDLQRVIELTNAQGATVTLGNAVTGWFTDVINATPVPITVTPATGLVGGQAAVTLPSGGSCRFVSKVTAWIALCGGAFTVTAPPPPPPPGPTYYVSTSGSDSNDGKTLATAWATLTMAANTLIAGDTVLIQDGTYVEANPVRPVNNGTQAKPITFRAQNKWGAVLSSGSSTGCNPAFNIHKSWIVVDGLTIDATAGSTACRTSGASANIFCWSDGVTPSLTSNQTTLNQGCTIRNTKLLNTGLKYYLAFKTTQDFSLFENNNTYTMECFNANLIVFRGNTISGPLDASNSSLTCKGGARNFQAYNNLFTAYNTDNIGTLLVGGTAGSTTGIWNNTTPSDPTYHKECINCVAYNNVVVGSSVTSPIEGIGMVGTLDSWAFNNVVIGPNVGLGLWFGVGDSTNGNNVNAHIMNNIVDCVNSDVWLTADTNVKNLQLDYNNLYRCTNIPAASTHTITGNPNLDGTYHLTTGSAAIDAGPPITSVPGYQGVTLDTSRDLAGTVRQTGTAGTFPNGWDLGVYQYP